MNVHHEHPSRADLIAATIAPGMLPDIDGHLAACEVCVAAGRDAVDALRIADEARTDEQWLQQRSAIMAALPEHRPAASARWWAVAAAIFVVATAGVLQLRDTTGSPTAAAPQAQVAIESLSPLSSDPWTSDEISGLEELIQWEEWDTQQSGGES